jgi:hypothetical protein
MGGGPPTSLEGAFPDASSGKRGVPGRSRETSGSGSPSEEAGPLTGNDGPASPSAGRNSATPGAQRKHRQTHGGRLSRRFPFSLPLQVQWGLETDPSRNRAASVVLLLAKTPSSTATSIKSEPEDGTQRLPGSSVSGTTPVAVCSEPSMWSSACSRTVSKSIRFISPWLPGVVNSLSSPAVGSMNQPRPAALTLPQRSGHAEWAPGGGAEPVTALLGGKPSPAHPVTAPGQPGRRSTNPRRGQRSAPFGYGKTLSLLVEAWLWAMMVKMSTVSEPRS